MELDDIVRRFAEAHALGERSTFAGQFSEWAALAFV